MLDLFAGMGGASASMRRHGWEVVTVDADPAFGCTITADLTYWSPTGLGRFDLVWASPPCLEFSRDHLPWLRGKYPPPSLDLVKAAARIVAEADPVWWVIENVRGSVRWIKPLLGPVRQQVGQAFLWGRFPQIDCRVDPHKERLSSSKRAERAAIPYAISDALRRACEAPRLVEII